MIFIPSGEMNLTDVFLVEIKIVSPIMLPRVMPPDAQRVYDKEAPTGHLSQAVGSSNSLPALVWEGAPRPSAEHRSRLMKGV